MAKEETAQETVTITKQEYEHLLEYAEKFSCLEAHGVDNWGGYGDAMQEYYEGRDE